MNINRKIQAENNRIEFPKDEIAIIDIIRIIWKWKYFIIAGTVFCCLITGVISFVMPKTYCIEMVLRPGMLSIGKQGKNVYIDSPENIKALIDSGTFNNEILNYLYEIKMENIPKKLNFKITIPKNSDTIKIEFETHDIKQGMVIQSRLSQLLLEKYSNLVTYFKNENDMEINLLKTETEFINNVIQSYKRNFKNIEKRIDELTSEIEEIKNNTTNLIMERNKLLSKNPKENNILSALLYSNTIQQNLELSNNCLNEINYYKSKKEAELQKIERSENEINHKLNEIKNLQFKKNNVQNIQVLQPAARSLDPIKPKILLNVILALVVGAFLMLILTFFWEYLSKYKKGSTDG